MAVHAVIFDIDGTLVDTNPWHVEAWWGAFKEAGYEVPRDRIEVEIGKGGDLLVPAILGPEVEERDGEALRKTQKEEFLKIAKGERFRLFPCVPQLFEALRNRDIRTALATSSDKKHLQAICESAGIDLPTLADVLVTNDDADASKPAPDLVFAAVERLSIAPADCAMVGDTIYDAQASRTAGVILLGLESGGTSAEELLEAGAAAVWRDTRHLLDELDDALDVASSAAATGD